MVTDGLRMFLQPGTAVVGMKSIYLIGLQIYMFIAIDNTAFGDMSAKLAAKHMVQFASGQVGIVLQHSIDELVHAVQTLCL